MLIKWPKNAYVLGGTLDIFMGGCAAGTLDSSAYTRASSAEAPILDQTPKIPPYPKVTISQKLLRLTILSCG